MVTYDYKQSKSGEHQQWKCQIKGDKMNFLAKQILVKALKKEMGKVLKDCPDEKLIEGYKEAAADFEATPTEELGIVLEIIGNEMDNRGLKHEEN